MSSAPSHGSSGAQQSTGFYRSEAPRRLSYASVAAGAVGIPQGGASVNLPPAPSSDPASQLHHHQSPSSRSPLPDPDAQIEGGTRIPEGWASRDKMSLLGHRNAWTMYNLGVAENEDGFFRPSYLLGTRYMEELEAEYDARVTARKESEAASSALPSRSSHHGPPGSISKSSSTVSLPKLQASHRGMAYEIIEHQPPVTYKPAPLPTRWHEVDKHNSLEIASDGQQIRYIGSNSKISSSDHEAAAARTDHPMPIRGGIYYYEVYIESKGREGMIGVGFSASKASLEKLPGWEPDSWAYHGDDGKSFCCQLTGKNFGPTFGTGDTVGCGVSFVDGTAFFTKNGNFLGNAFREIKALSYYPSVGMKRPHAHLITNFGQRPFIFDIDTYVDRKRQEILNDVAATNISKLHPTLNKDDLCKALVAQYLSHDGYVETAQAFAAETRQESTALRGSPDSAVDSYIAIEEERDATNRQRIRAAVLDGDIDTAISLTETFFPTVLSTNREINFRVRCRKFIEMMLQSAELRYQASPVDNEDESIGNTTDTKPTPDPSKSKDKDAIVTPNGSADEAMAMEAEYDDNNDDSTPLPTSHHPGDYNALISQVLAYGQSLQASLHGEADSSVRDHFKATIEELFGMLSYPDARTSPQARWPETSRARVAEGLNSAILVSLGKSSSTALERVYRQAVVLADLMGEDGGEGALINVGRLIREEGESGEGGVGVIEY